ncbi:MAG: PCMD domain-containing protein [Bacteroidales bacterium]
MTKLLNIVFCLIVLLFTGCIENDIPYPTVVAEITAFEVKGQKAVVIDKATRTIDVDLSDNVDMANVELVKMEVSNNATVLPEISSTMNLTEPFVYTLTTYQDYLWTIKATQTIERYFEVKNQTAPTIIDESKCEMLVTVDPSVDKSNMQVLRARFGPDDVPVSPNPLTYKDFSVPASFVVRYSKNKVEVWTVTVAKKSAGVTTNDADAYAKYAILSGQCPSGSSNPTFEYKKTSDAEWTSVPVGDVTVSGTSFTAKISSLEPKTTYVCKAVAGTMSGVEKLFTTEEVKQVVNSNFEDWFQEGKSWFPDKDFTPENYWWDTGNRGANTLSEKNPTISESTVVVKGKAAKMSSTAVIGVFAAGSIYTGQYVKTDGIGAQLAFGRPFDSRPKGLRGYYHYTPGRIDKTKDPYTSLSGRADTCHIYALLTDWSAPHDINTNNKSTLVDLNNDPGIIAICQLRDGVGTNGAYKEFNLDFSYKSHVRKPKYILIVSTASKYGDYFTGSTKSVLYVDEFELVY